MAHTAHSAVRNQPQSQGQGHGASSRSHTNVNTEEHLSDCSYSIEISPNICLISLRYGDGVEIFVNADCTVTNFLQYIAEMMNQNGLTINPEEYCLLDLVNEEGTVQGIRMLPPQEHVTTCLHHRMLYIPIKLEHPPEPTLPGTTPPNATPAKDAEDEDWLILLVPHDAYYTYIEEAMLSIKEAKHMDKLPKNTHGDNVSIKSHDSAKNHHPPKSPLKKGKK